MWQKNKEVLNLNNEKIKQITLFIYSFSIYCNVYFYMTWSTYNRTISLILLFLSYLGPALLFLYTLLTQNLFTKISIIGMVALFVFFILFFHMNYLGVTYVQSFSFSDLRLVLCVIILIFASPQIRSDIFDYSMKIFAIICFPSVVYFLLRNVGFNLPFSILESAHYGKIIRGVYYLHMPLGIQIASPFMLTRPCGVFDEPGVMGTLAAIFYAGNKSGKKWSILLLIDGFFSISMAFYLLIIIYYICKFATQGLIKISILLLSIIVSLNIFMNINFKNETIRSVQERIDFSSNFLVKDDRTTDVFDNEFSHFVDEGGVPFLFGYGRYAYQYNPAMSLGYSYKMIIYDHGIIGFLLYILFFILVYIYSGIGKKTLPFAIVFFASIYQRPYVLDPEYFSIFIGAITGLMLYQNNTYFLLNNHYFAYKANNVSRKNILKEE